MSLYFISPTPQYTLENNMSLNASTSVWSCNCGCVNNWGYLDCCPRHTSLVRAMADNVLTCTFVTGKVWDNILKSDVYVVHNVMVTYKLLLQLSKYITHWLSLNTSIQIMKPFWPTCHQEKLVMTEGQSTEYEPSIHIAMTGKQNTEQQPSAIHMEAVGKNVTA